MPMFLTELLLYLDVFILIYVFGGYALVTYVFKKQARLVDDSFKPTCTIIIAAFNEEKVIADKIVNCLRLTYPPDLLQVVVIADGSTDRTTEIAQTFDSVKVFYTPERKGKLAAIQRVMPEIDSEIIVFTDANCLLNPVAIDQLTRHFADKKVGAVSGEKKVLQAASSADAESYYWRYESWLKKKDSDFFSLVGAAGEILAMRKALYTYIPETLVLDDFVQSMLICGKGLQVVYEPMAIASELPSVNLKDEFTRKVRIAAGGFQSVLFLRQRIKFSDNRKLGFLYYSHRVFRWTIAPLAFFLLLPLNLLTVLANGGIFYDVLLWLQLCVYLLVLVKSFRPVVVNRIPGLSAIHYLFFMQLTAIVGFLRFKNGGQSPSWEKIPRF